MYFSLEILHQIVFEKGTGPKGVVFHPDDPTLFLSAYEKKKVIVIDIGSVKTLLNCPQGMDPMA